MTETILEGFHIPHKMWIELCGEGQDACDVIVEMEDGTVYTAMFVTLAYLNRQMQLGFEMSSQLPDTPPVRYAALDTPHILVETLDRETLEDTIDCVLAQEVFEGLFTRVTENVKDSRTTDTTDGERVTQEVAAVVISDVLVVTE
jgi:hypothetical protein